MPWPENRRSDRLAILECGQGHRDRARTFRVGVGADRAVGGTRPGSVRVRLRRGWLWSAERCRPTVRRSTRRGQADQGTMTRIEGSGRGPRRATFVVDQAGVVDARAAQLTGGSPQPFPCSLIYALLPVRTEGSGGVYHADRANHRPAACPDCRANRGPVEPDGCSSLAPSGAADFTQVE